MLLLAAGHGRGRADVAQQWVLLKSLGLEVGAQEH